MQSKKSYWSRSDKKLLSVFTKMSSEMLDLGDLVFPLLSAGDGAHSKFGVKIGDSIRSFVSSPVSAFGGLFYHRVTPWEPYYLGGPLFHTEVLEFIDSLGDKRIKDMVSGLSKKEEELIKLACSPGVSKELRFVK